MKLKRRVNNDLIITIVAALLLMALVAPYIIATFYANPSGDDFAFIANTLKQNANSWLMKSFLRAKELYFDWQGTYTTNFFNCYISGVFHYFGILGIHVEFVGFIILFVISLYYFISKLWKQIIYCSEINRKWISLLTTALVIFSVLYNYNVSEVFYWHTGIIAYTFPISLLFISFGKAFDKKNSIPALLIASVFVLGGVGGSLNVAAFANVVYLLYFLYLIHEKSNYMKMLLLLGLAFCGAIINVAAPGNYVRHDIADGGGTVLELIIASIVGVVHRNIGFIFGVTSPFFVLLSIVLFNYIADSKTKFINPIAVGLLFLLGESIIDFPVYFGYGDTSMPLRCEFISRVVMVVFFLLWLINLMGWIAKKTHKTLIYTKQYAVLLGLFAFVSIIPFVSKDISDDYYPFIIAKDYYNGELQRYENANNIILDALRNADNEDVVVDIYEWADIDYLRSMRLSSDPDYWINHETTSYYTNVKSISVNYE